MHLSDLKAMQAAKKWERFIYLSENQLDYSRAEPLELSLTFSSMDVDAAPPAPSIHFKGMGSYLWMKRVAAVDCESHVLGDILTIICRSGKRYIIVAQEGGESRPLP